VQPIATDVNQFSGWFDVTCLCKTEDAKKQTCNKRNYFHEPDFPEKYEKIRKCQA
jgi:hypothetical protein